MRIDVHRMPPAQSRAAAIVVTLVALAIAYFVLLHWWFVAPLLKIHGQMDDLDHLHARYVAAVARQPLLARRVQQLERGGATVGAFLPGNDPSAAAAVKSRAATARTQAKCAA